MDKTQRMEKHGWTCSYFKFKLVCHFWQTQQWICCYCTFCVFIFFVCMYNTLNLKHLLMQSRNKTKRFFFVCRSNFTSEIYDRQTFCRVKNCKRKNFQVFLFVIINKSTKTAAFLHVANMNSDS